MKKPDVARPFLLAAVDPRLVKNGRVWAVKQGDRWRFAADVCCQVTVTSTLDPDRRTPALAGVGVVTCLERGDIIITA